LQTFKEFCNNNEDKLQSIEFEASSIMELCLEDVVKVFRSLILKRVNSRILSWCEAAAHPSCDRDSSSFSGTMLAMLVDAMISGCLITGVSSRSSALSA